MIRVPALAAVLLFSLAGPVTAATPAMSSVPNFGAVSVEGAASAQGRIYTQVDSTTLVGGVGLFLLAGLDRQPNGQSGVSALTAEALLQTPVTVGGRSLSYVEAAQALGGSVDYSIEGQSVEFYLEARSEHLPELTNLLATVLTRPAFSQTTIASARTSLLARIAATQDNPLQAGIANFRQAFYRTSNAGLPPLGTSADVQRLTPTMVRRFFREAYLRGGANATVIGVTSPATQAAVRDLVAVLPPGHSQAVRVGARPALSPQTQIISYRDTQSPWFVLGFNAPAANSPDFGAMMVLANMLQTDLVRESITSVPASERPVGLRYDFLSDPGTMVIYIDGAAGDPMTIERELAVLLDAMINTKLDVKYVDQLKTMAEGRFVLDNASIESRAGVISSLANLGLGADGVNAALRRMAAVTPADLQRVIKRYCSSPLHSVILPHESDGDAAH